MSKLGPQTIPYRPTELIPTVQYVVIELAWPESLEIHELRAIIDELNAPTEECREFATT